MMRLSGSSLAILAFFVAALLPRATWPLVDPDVWWHIRAGQTTLGTGRVPDVDTWSLTAAGNPWTSQDWLANVVLAMGHGLGTWGDTTLSALFALVAVAAFWLLWRAMRIRSPQIGWLSRVTWLSVGLVLAGPTLGVRVQVFDLLLAALVILVLWSFLADRRRTWLVGLPVIAVAWVNLHAGWPLLLLLGGAVLIGEATDRVSRRRAAALEPRELAWLGGALLVSVGALVVNPNTLQIYRYPFDTLALGTLKAAVGEWQPARFDSLFGWLWLGFVLGAVIPTIAWRWRSIPLADALILLGLTAMAGMAVRFLLVLGPIGGAIVAIHLAPAIGATGLGRAMAPHLGRLGRPRTGLAYPVVAALLLALGLGLAALRASPVSQAAEVAVEQPAAALDWILDHDPGKRVFNRYEWGGYLGLRRPATPIYIDGRADVYGDGVIAEYVRTIGLTVDPQTTFDRYGIDHVLFPADTPLGGWLDASGSWERAYHDDVATIWVPS
ncbi:MAG: hypothetical protein ABI622_01885 [Chloroflexota bacterium]